MFCCTLLYVHSSIAIILMGKRELIALLNLSSWCLVMVERLFLTVPRGCLQFVIVVFPDHTHLLFLLCCKIQEHMITNNVLKHLESYDILTDCPHGFRARRSCETQLLTLAQELLTGLDKKHQHDLIILDFSKAFDRVPHQRLVRKLDHYGKSGSTFN